MLELLMLLVLAAPGEPTPAAPPQPSVRQLAWMSGCWAAEGRDAGSGEIWTTADGETLLGISRTVKEGRTIEHEFMQIRALDDGSIAFIAMPSGQQTTEFRMIELAANRARFENLQHDFPQRVIYERDGEKLTGSIEGTKNGKSRRIAFPYRKVSCP